MKYIRDRGMKATKIFATLMAIGVVASAIFGMTQAGKDLVDKTLYTVGLYTVCSPYTVCPLEVVPVVMLPYPREQARHI